MSASGWGMGMDITGMGLQEGSQYVGAGWSEHTGEVAINKAIGIEKDAYHLAEGTIQPYTAVGQEGMNRLSQLGQFSFNSSNLQNEPGYQFQLQQGQQGIESSAFAKGLGMSTATAKALAGFNQQMAGTAYQNAFNRALQSYTTNYDVGMGETQFGFGASNRLSQLQTGLGDVNADLELNRGNVRMAGIQATVNAAQKQGSDLQQLGGQMQGGGMGGGGGSGGGSSAGSTYNPQFYTPGVNQSDVGMLQNNSQYMNNQIPLSQMGQ